jgi:small subunit ribosomal protein S16
MLAIRLSRTGMKKQAHYRVVVCETKQATEGRFVEIVGHYNPRTVPATVTVNHERIAHWIKLGARPSQTVRTLLAGHVTNKPEAAAAEAPQAAAQ